MNESRKMAAQSAQQSQHFSLHQCTIRYYSHYKYSAKTILHPAVSAVTPPSLPHHHEDRFLRWMALVPEAPAAMVALWCSKCFIHNRWRKGGDVYLQLNYRSMFGVSASTHGDKSTLMSCSCWVVEYKAVNLPGPDMGILSWCCKDLSVIYICMYTFHISDPFLSHSLRRRTMSNKTPSLGIDKFMCKASTIEAQL